MFSQFLVPGIQKAFNRTVFNAMPRHDQSGILQGMYDSGYSAPDLAKFFGMSDSTVYSRINAHRGRGPAYDPK